MKSEQYPIDYELRVPGHFANVGQDKNINELISRGEQFLKYNNHSDKELWIYECRPILKLVKHKDDIMQLPISPLTMRGNK